MPQVTIDVPEGRYAIHIAGDIHERVKVSSGAPLETPVHEYVPETIDDMLDYGLTECIGNAQNAYYNGKPATDAQKLEQAKARITEIEAGTFVRGAGRSPITPYLTELRACVVGVVARHFPAKSAKEVKKMVAIDPPAAYKAACMVAAGENGDGLALFEKHYPKLTADVDVRVKASEKAKAALVKSLDF